jgi:hypothetical protein
MRQASSSTLLNICKNSTNPLKLKRLTKSTSPADAKKKLKSVKIKRKIKIDTILLSAN